jgi:DNA-directed RNA polymerase specialized sigma24 family protein
VNQQAIAERFRAEIFAYIKSKVSDPTMADDLIQETFVKLGRAWRRGHAGAFS